MDTNSLQVALYKAKKLFELIREKQSKDKYFSFEDVAEKEHKRKDDSNDISWILLQNVWPIGMKDSNLMTWQSIYINCYHNFD